MPQEALSRIAQLYAVEWQIRDQGLSVEQARDLRQERSVPELAELKAWMLGQLAAMTAGTAGALAAAVQPQTLQCAFALRAQRAAAIMSLIESAKLCGLEPQAYLSDVLRRLPTQLDRDIHELLPTHWKPQPQQA